MVFVRGIADAIDGKVKNKPLHAELRGKYETTLAYRSKTANKGAATRARQKKPAAKTG